MFFLEIHNSFLLINKLIKIVEEFGCCDVFILCTVSEALYKVHTTLCFYQ